MWLEPSNSPYDLQFRFLGFQTRVTWTFWLAAVILGWSWSQGMHSLAQLANLNSPGAPALLLIWVGCVFVSILIHELGHALAFRFFGQRAHIILYHFGGLAVSDSYTSWDGARRPRTNAKEDLIISVAGPVAQLILAMVAAVIAYQVDVAPDWFTRLFGLSPVDSSQWSSITKYALFDALVLCSIFWAIINLSPVLPLDGGHIMYNLMIMFNARDAWLLSRQVSIAAAIGIGILMMQWMGSTNGLMFFLLAAMNWQEMQQGRRGF